MSASTGSVGGPTQHDQTAADLSAAVLAADAAGLTAAAGTARDAAGNTAYDPSFSPD